MALFTALYAFERRFANFFKLFTMAGTTVRDQKSVTFFTVEVKALYSVTLKKFAVVLRTLYEKSLKVWAAISLRLQYAFTVVAKDYSKLFQCDCEGIAK